MLYSISVEAAEGGRMVEADVLKGPLVFRAGARAEDAARRIGRALAQQGSWAEIVVTTRDGYRMSRLLSPAEYDQQTGHLAQARAARAPLG